MSLCPFAPPPCAYFDLRAAHPDGYKGLPARRIYSPSYIMAYTLNVYTSAVIFLISVENISRIGQTRSNVYYSSSPSLWQRQVPCGKSRGVRLNYCSRTFIIINFITLYVSRKLVSNLCFYFEHIPTWKYFSALQIYGMAPWEYRKNNLMT